MSDAKTPDPRQIVSLDIREQAKLRQFYPDRGERTLGVVRAALQNPFFRLSAEELDFAKAEFQPKALMGLLEARERAKSPGRLRAVIFCMPKSASSFAQSAIQHALDVPFVTLTGFTTPGLSSVYGMNSREQELDEAAIAKAILSNQKGFVAQHHTRYSRYMALQMAQFNLKPIVTVRNILDCIISYDDMMLTWRSRQKTQEVWINDPPFAIPLDYVNRPKEERYDLLAQSFGVWLISFYLSWKRAQRDGKIELLMLRYESDTTVPDRFIDLVSSYLDLDEQAKGRLRAFVSAPDKEKSRINVGIVGRGRDQVTSKTRAFLKGYVSNFRGELDDDDIAYLVG